MSDQKRYDAGEKELFSKGGYTLTFKVIHDDEEDHVRLWRDGEPEPIKTFNDIDVAEQALFELLSTRQQ